MIDKKELRVGNLLHCQSATGENKIVTVDEIGDDGINILWAHEMTGWEHSYENLFPIELTTDWINKLGLTQTKSDVWEIGQLRIWLGNGCLCYLIDEDNGDGHYLPNGTIKHVHQLMNLYYSLTGEELTIKSI